MRKRILRSARDALILENVRSMAFARSAGFSGTLPKQPLVEASATRMFVTTIWTVKTMTISSLYASKVRGYARSTTFKLLRSKSMTSS